MNKVNIIGKTNLRDYQIQSISQLCNLTVFDTNVPSNSIDDVINRIGESEIVILNVFTPVTKKVIDSCSSIRIIISCSAGINHVDLDYCSEKNIRVIWYPGYNARTVAEKAMGYILITMNNIIEAYSNYKEFKWDYLSQNFQGRELNNKTICILGCGHSGSLLRTFSKSFGLETLCVNSKTSQDEVNNMFRKADIISLHMSLNGNTSKFLNSERLQLLKPDVIIINNARGGLIDEDALLNFMENNPKAKAFLDVLEIEPPPVDHPFRKIPHIYITPHIGWNSKEADEFLANSLHDDIIKSLSV